MYKEDTIRRLRVDPGQLTLGQLLQDREAAVYEIRRLQEKVDRLTRQKDKQHDAHQLSDKNGPYRTGTLINIKQVAELLALSRSTIYKRLADGSFPEPVRPGPRMVRWPVDKIVAWRDAL